MNYHKLEWPKLWYGIIVILIIDHNDWLYGKKKLKLFLFIKKSFSILNTNNMVSEQYAEIQF